MKFGGGGKGRRNGSLQLCDNIWLVYNAKSDLVYQWSRPSVCEVFVIYTKLAKIILYPLLQQKSQAGNDADLFVFR